MPLVQHVIRSCMKRAQPICYMIIDLHTKIRCDGVVCFSPFFSLGRQH